MCKHKVTPSEDGTQGCEFTTGEKGCEYWQKNFCYQNRYERVYTRQLAL
ncbi:hypothetical protein [Brasilonema sennae]|nr:hypothetical protein [Brasilonema sennae]